MLILGFFLIFFSVNRASGLGRILAIAVLLCMAGIRFTKHLRKNRKFGILFS